MWVCRLFNVDHDISPSYRRLVYFILILIAVFMLNNSTEIIKFIEVYRVRSLVWFILRKLPCFVQSSNKRTTQRNVIGEFDCISCDFCTYEENEKIVCAQTQLRNVLEHQNMLKFLSILFFVLFYFILYRHCKPNGVISNRRKKMIDFNEQFLFVFKNKWKKIQKQLW